MSLESLDEEVQLEVATEYSMVHRVATPAQGRRERTFGKGLPIWRPAQRKIFTISGPRSEFSSQKLS